MAHLFKQFPHLCIVYLIEIGGAVVDLGCWPLLQGFCICFWNVDLISGVLFDIQNHEGKYLQSLVTYVSFMSIFILQCIKSIFFTNIFFTGFYSCNTEIMPGINNWTPEIQVRLFKIEMFC